MISYLLHILILCCIFLRGFCILPINGNSECPIREDDDGTDWKEALKGIKAVVSTKNYDNSKIKYYVMTPSSSPHYVNPNGNPYDWSKSECRNKPLLFTCHGWFSDGNQSWVHDLLSTFVNEHGGCGVSSDYSGATKNYNYFAAACETNNIAEGLSEYIYNNVCKATDCKKNLHTFGHSLGAHTCGVAGFMLKQKGIVVPRLITADAAGPAYNIANVSDSSIHLSRDSAATVINLKTTCIQGDSRAEWVHQQQIIGSCACTQNQCKAVDTSCNHAIGIYMVRSTMKSSFQDIKLRQINDEVLYNCLNPSYVDPENTDNLGWKSKGKHGIFKIGKLEECVDISNSLESSRKKRFLGTRRKPYILKL